jgi:tetratricopeptide (TPR) repeat protein
VQLGWSDVRSIVNERVHYIDSASPELYDIARDAGERTNVIANERRTAAALQADVTKYPPATAASTAVDAETAAKLASLGYVGAARSRPDPRSLPNPREAVRYLDDIQAGFQLADQKQYAAAIAKLRGIVEKNPRMTDVWIRLAQTYCESGDAGPCVAAYRNAMASSGVASAEIAVMLGNAELQDGHLDEAEKAARASLSASPEAAKELLAQVALARKDLPAAESLARELSTPAGLVLLGEVLNARGDRNGALAASDRARESAHGAVYGLEALRGDVFALTDRPKDAIAAFEAEIASFPQNRVAYSRLAVLYYLTGDRAKFEGTLRRLVTANPNAAARALAARTRAELK